tara:strand:+ start:139 stop:1317 length:1179 start_codon:yes stop_codon:yes gene_type:complete
MGYGAADTDLNLLKGLGALSGGRGEQALALADALTPAQEKADPAMLALRFFSQMGAAASQPGSTGLSAAASALPSAAEYLMQVNERNRKLKQSRGPLAVQLASTLKGKSGVKEYIDRRIVDNPDTPVNESRVFLTETEALEGRDFLTTAPTLKTTAEMNKLELENFSKIRNAYKGEKAVDFYQKLRSTWQKIDVAYEQAYEVENPQVADVSMVFNYMKMLDPGSTVREGEYATAKNTTGIAGSIMNSYNKAVGGGFLSDAQRRDFRQMAWKLFQEESSNVQELNERYKSQGEAFNVDVGTILEDPTKITYDDKKIYSSKIPSDILSNSTKLADISNANLISSIVGTNASGDPEYVTIVIKEFKRRFPKLNPNSSFFKDLPKNVRDALIKAGI